MKKASLLMIAVIGAFVVYLSGTSTAKPVLNPYISSPSPSISMSATHIPNGKILPVSLDAQNYSLSFLRIPTKSTCRLIPNFSQKDYGSSLVQKFNCRTAINGGFYQEDSKPLGLFYTEGTSYGKTVSSSISNGYLFKTKSGTIDISSTSPSLSDLDFIFQSGPIFSPGKYRMKLVQDEEARRSLVIKSGDTLYIASIFSQDNNYKGPYLADLPMIFSSETVQNELHPQLILNLDGGSASFFFSRDHTAQYQLSEITPIGSLVCISY